MSQKLPLRRTNTKEEKSPKHPLLQLFFFMLGLVIALEIYFFQPQTEVWNNVRLWPSGEIWAIFLLVSASLWFFSKKGVSAPPRFPGDPLNPGGFSGEHQLFPLTLLGLCS
jgi:hypothetical protein